MLTTATYRVFPVDPGHGSLSRARHLLREGRRDEAEAAYRAILNAEPELRAAWGEYFEMLRGEARFEEAQALADRIRSRCPDDPLAAVLGGAALVERGALRAGLMELDRAAELDPDLGAVWHEIGYAAWRMGDRAGALLALDRAFTLEPHGATLQLRGTILREAGRYAAAEVSFAGAAEGAEFPEQRNEAERQIAITRRYAAFPGRRPADLSPERRWFAETGAAVLTASAESGRVTDEALAAAFAELAADEGWRFTHLLTTDIWEGWLPLARRLGAAATGEFPAEADAVVCVVSRTADDLPGTWTRAIAEVRSRNRGLSFVLNQAAQAAPADVAGMLEGRSATRLDPVAASEASRHPESRLQGRALA